jgi:hypothetical protein
MHVNEQSGLLPLGFPTATPGELPEAERAFPTVLLALVPLIRAQIVLWLSAGLPRWCPQQPSWTYYTRYDFASTTIQFQFLMGAPFGSHGS